MKPIFKHDCDECKFLGTFLGKFDFYYHERDGFDEYIIRYGNDGKQYYSPFIRTDELDEELTTVGANLINPTDYRKRLVEEARIRLMVKKMSNILVNEFKYKDTPEGEMQEIPFEEKLEKNIWDRLEDFLEILRAAKRGAWVWWRNSKFKYVNIRVDMRDGRCVFIDDDKKRVDINDIRYQYEGSKK